MGRAPRVALRWLSLPTAAALAALAVVPARAQQDTPDQQARRLLEEGRNYWAQGKTKQALENFSTIVTGFASTDVVDDALLEIGRYRLEVENDADKARASFEQIAKQYPQSDSAPGAYYYLGVMATNRAVAPAELDDALAQFSRLMTLYPLSDVWVPKALYASGLAQRKAGRLPEALEAERRVSLEYPSSDAAPAAQFEIGQVLALMGQPLPAMEEFQAVRNHFPESPQASVALDRITALYRLHGAGKPVFASDPSFSAGAGDVLKDVRAILMSPAGALWIASDKTKSTLAIEPGGKIGQSFSAEDQRSLSLSPKGELLITSRTAVRVGPKDLKSFAIPGDKGLPEPLDKLLAAARTPGGSFLVSDEKKNRIYRFDTASEYKGTFPDAKDTKNRDVTRMFLDGEGAIVCLDRDEKTIKAYDEAGRPLRSIGPGGLKKPVDAAVDPFRNTYVADEEGAVYIFSPQGQLLATITGEAVKKPKALTLDSTGAVLVYDDRTQKVQRFK
jgi:TolA-binding protein